MAVTARNPVHPFLHRENQAVRSRRSRRSLTADDFHVGLMTVGLVLAIKKGDGGGAFHHSDEQRPN